MFREKFEAPPAPTVKEKMYARERSILSKLRDNAGKIGRAMILVSALAGASWIFEAVAEAKSARSVKKPEKKFDESKLTDGSRWSREIVQAAQKEKSKIGRATEVDADLENELKEPAAESKYDQAQAHEDAEAFVKYWIGQFVNEFYFPTKGDLHDGPLGFQERDYTEEDLKLIIDSVLKMQDILRMLDTNFEVSGYQELMEQLQRIIQRCRLDLSVQRETRLRAGNPTYSATKIDEMMAAMDAEAE